MPGEKRNIPAELPCGKPFYSINTENPKKTIFRDDLEKPRKKTIFRDDLEKLRKKPTFRDTSEKPRYPRKTAIAPDMIRRFNCHIPCRPILCYFLREPAFSAFPAFSGVFCFCGAICGFFAPVEAFFSLTNLPRWYTIYTADLRGIFFTAGVCVIFGISADLTCGLSIRGPYSNGY